MHILKIFFLLSIALVSLPSSVAGSDYTRMRKSMNENSLPLINIVINNSLLNTETFVNGTLEISDFKKRTEGQEVVQYDCMLRIRGVSASQYAKKSFALKLLDQDGEELDVSLFGIRPDENWILDAMAVDRIRMRNRICFDLWNEMSATPYETMYDNRNGTLGEFVEVFFNGGYWGLYCLTDKINRKLLNLEKYEKKKKIVHGVLYKGESGRKPGHDLLSYENADFGQKNWNAWNLQYPEDYPSISTWQPLMDLIDFCSSKTSDNKFLKNYQNFFYVDNLVDYLVMTMALNVGDNMYKNTILSVPDILEGHRFLYTPWDMDHSLGGRYNGEYENVMSDPHRYDSSAPYDRLYGKGLDGFPIKVSKRWNDLKDNVFSIEHVNSLLEGYKKCFISSGAWSREYKKWNGNPVELKNDLSVELDYVKDWYARNYASLCNAWKLLGDANGDGKVNVADVVAIFNYIHNHRRNLNKICADVNCDNEIDEQDVKLIIDFIMNSK